MAPTLIRSSPYLPAAAVRACVRAASGRGGACVAPPHAETGASMRARARGPAGRADWAARFGFCQRSSTAQPFIAPLRASERASH